MAGGASRDRHVVRRSRSRLRGQAGARPALPRRLPGRVRRQQRVSRLDESTVSQRTYGPRSAPRRSPRRHGASAVGVARCVARTVSGASPDQGRARAASSGRTRCSRRLRARAQLRAHARQSRAARRPAGPRARHLRAARSRVHVEVGPRRGRGTMTEPSAIFRQEALEARAAGQRVSGDPLQANSRWLRWSYWAVLGLVAAGLTMAMLLHTEATATGTAVVNRDGTFSALVPAAVMPQLRDARSVRIESVAGGDPVHSTATVTRVAAADEAAVS